ncbi:DUF6366 family protein [Halobacillus seohaensis]|uniref:DUF6366 family protein n=1 Tax=Halobacillus seohaensis TaxID=447421 RepID=A0ABW2ES42_9BACI
MNDNKETPEERRERLRQEELRKNPAGSVHGGGLADLVGSLGWKGSGFLVIAIIIVFIVAHFLFK